MRDISDRLLVDLAISGGDQQAFSELIARHQSTIRYSLRQLTNWDDALADDLAQEAFIQAYKALRSFKGKAKFSSWLYRIAYNCFLQHIRKKSLNCETLSSEHLELTTSSEKPIEQTDEQASDDELHRQLANLLAQLKPERRSVLHLFLHKQYTHQEISDTMGIPLGSVKTHISRGRKVLQAGLSEWR